MNSFTQACQDTLLGLHAMLSNSKSIKLPTDRRCCRPLFNESKLRELVTDPGLGMSSFLIAIASECLGVGMFDGTTACSGNISVLRTMKTSVRLLRS